MNKWLVFLFLMGCTPSAEVKLKHKPRFKPGDCILSYGSFKGLVHEIWGDGKEYAVLIGGGYCDSVDAMNNWWKCSKSAYPVDVIDKNAELRKCDEEDQV